MEFKQTVSDWAGYVIIFCGLALFKIYGSKNARRLGDKLLKWGDEKEKRNA